jgi:phosphatidylglycerophosphate synthase
LDERIEEEVEQDVIETALIAAPSRANNMIFGRSLIERLMINCERAGIRRFVIAVPPERKDDVSQSLGRFRSRQEVLIVESADQAVGRIEGLAPDETVLSLSGNLIVTRPQLEHLISEYEGGGGIVARTVTTDRDRGGEIAVGPVAEILKRGGMVNDILPTTAALLPFALNGRPEDRDEAELRLARELRHETAAKDAILARLIDRKLSWRISYRLARSAITPNQVTIANTILGLGCAWLFAMPGYWSRLLASLLFLLSVTLDGVDGELARLKMSETKFGGQIDIVTDNIVHVAIFIGIFLGCYRASTSSAYLYLLPLVLGGFGMCAVATWRAFHLHGDVAAKWLDAVDRWSGRDFAYFLVVFALTNRLEWFAWGTAFGTYIFAAVLMWLTARHQAPHNRTPSRLERRIGERQ